MNHRIAILTACAALAAPAAAAANVVPHATGNPWGKGQAAHVDRARMGSWSGNKFRIQMGSWS